MLCRLKYSESGMAGIWFPIPGCNYCPFQNKILLQKKALQFKTLIVTKVMAKKNGENNETRSIRCGIISRVLLNVPFNCGKFSVFDQNRHHYMQMLMCHTLRLYVETGVSMEAESTSNNWIRNKISHLCVKLHQCIRALSADG